MKFFWRSWISQNLIKKLFGKDLGRKYYARLLGYSLLYGTLKNQRKSYLKGIIYG